MKIPLPTTLVLLSLLTVNAAPPAFTIETVSQTVFKPFWGISDDQVRGATQWLDDARKAILKEKKNLEKWFYKGRQYIKQDNLLCKRL